VLEKRLGPYVKELRIKRDRRYASALAPQDVGSSS